MTQPNIGFGPLKGPDTQGADHPHPYAPIDHEHEEDGGSQVLFAYDHTVVT